MEISGVILALYVAAWGIFYILLTKIIAERSVTAWINRFDQDKNTKAAETLLHLLKPVLDEIFTDNETLLKDFKKSFFTSVATQVREAKAVATALNPVPDMIKNLSEENPLLGLILSHVDLPSITATSKNIAETSKNIAETSPIITDWGLK